MFAEVQPQIRLSRADVRTVAHKTIVRKDRPDVVVEIHLIGEVHARVQRSGGNQEEQSQHNERADPDQDATPQKTEM